MGQILRQGQHAVLGRDIATAIDSCRKGSGRQWELTRKFKLHNTVQSIARRLNLSKQACLNLQFARQLKP